ncbi:MAG TPA: hypothetical protein VK646_06530 [Actinomycetota bacterium]|nr:hypothetical protein [Actinomycetota bacterium]
MVSNGSGDDAAAVAVFETDEQARFGLDALLRSGVPEDRISIIGAGEIEPDAEAERSAGEDTPGMRGGALAGGIAGAVVALAIPGGVVLVSGLLAASVGALAGASLGIMANLGVPRDRISDYEEDLADGRYLVIAHGDASQVGEAARVLDMTDTQELDVYL